ncbi:MAG: hypothetical protein ACE5FK_11100 [Candidatus Methylomirabilia bacterium]
MTSVQDLLARCVGRDSLTFPDTFQGLPQMAHGGSVLAAFDLLTAPRDDAPRELAGAYRRKIPLNTPLPLAVERSGPETTFRLSNGEQVLVEGQVTPGESDVAPTTLPEASGTRFPLPISNRCFACGVQNPLGLQASLWFDERQVWTEYRPREPLRTADGRLATAVFTTLLDETAFWLGALATGESGMTTELRVTLHEPIYPFGKSVVAVGVRDRVTPHEAESPYWRTESALVTPDGKLLASAVITFVAIRGAARRLITRMLGINPREVVRRVFPAY